MSTFIRITPELCRLRRKRLGRAGALTCGLVIATLAGNTHAGVTVSGGNGEKTSLANILTAKAGVNVTIGQNGALAIANGGNACADLIRQAIAEQTNITLNLGRDIDGVLFGAFNRANPNDADSKSSGTQDIDMDDIEQAGADNTDGNQTAAGLVVHEMWEALHSVKDNLNFVKAHKKAIESYENGCFGKSNTPSVRWCDKDVVRTDPNDSDKHKIYVKMKRGSDKKMGFSCVPFKRVPGNPKSKFRVTAAPTFVEGDDPPQSNVAADETLADLGVDPGPMYSTDCTGACCGTDNHAACLPATRPMCAAGEGNYSGDGSACSADLSQCVPTLSAWGLTVLALLTLTAATAVILRRRGAATV